MLYHSGLVAPRDEPLGELKLQAVQADDYTLLMVGSSRFYRHFDSDLIEAELQTKGHDFSVYNMGVPGLWPPRQDKFQERVEKLATPKILLVELNVPKSLFGNLRSGSVLRSLSLGNALEAFSISRETTPDTKITLKLGSSYIAALLYKYSGVGLFRFAIQSERDDIDRAAAELANAKNGFLSLDRQHAMQLGSASKPTPAKESELLKLRIDDLNKYSVRQTSLSTTLLSKCESAIEQAQSRNCRLIYVLSPRLGGSQLAAVYPVFRKLPDKCKIDLSDPVEYPEFYSEAFSFDKGHLNEAGSQLMSTALVKKLDDLLKPGGKSQN